MASTWLKVILLGAVFALLGGVGYTTAAHLQKSKVKTVPHTVTWTPSTARVIGMTAPDEDAPKPVEKAPSGADLDRTMLEDTNVYVYRGAPVAEGFAIYIIMWKGNYLFMQVVKENCELIAPEPDDAEPQ